MQRRGFVRRKGSNTWHQIINLNRKPTASGKWGYLLEVACEDFVFLTDYDITGRYLGSTPAQGMCTRCLSKEVSS